MSELNTSKKDHLKKALDALNTHFSDPDFTVKTWANQLGLSVPYLSKLLRNATKNAAMWHIHNKRFQKARSLLEQNEKPISEIATLAGFADNNYFSRVFKRKFNKSPTDWREAYTEKGN